MVASELQIDMKFQRLYVAMFWGQSTGLKYSAITVQYDVKVSGKAHMAALTGNGFKITCISA